MKSNSQLAKKMLVEKMKDKKNWFFFQASFLKVHLASGFNLSQSISAS